MKRFLRPETAVFFLVFFAFLIGGRSRFLRDPGTFSHTAFGEHMLASGSLIRTDYASFTAYGEPWIAQQWLGECAMAVVHRVAGFDGLLVMTVALIAFLYAWVARRLIHHGLHFLSAMLIVALALAASAHSFHIRPHMLSVVFLGLTFSLLCDFEAGRARPVTVFWLVPLCALWTNIHGGVLGGLGTIIITILGWVFLGVARQTSPVKTRRQMIALCGVAAACILTVLINPYGLDMPRAWLSIMRSPVVPEIIQEHGSIVKTGSWMIVPFGLFYMTALAGTLPKRPRVTWLIPLIWLVLSCVRVRHAPLFAITAAIAMPDIFPHIRWAKWLSQKGSELCRIQPRQPRASRGFVLPWIIPLAAVLAMIGYRAARPADLLAGNSWARLDPDHWPVELLPALQEYEASHPAGTPVFNDMLFGGFLIYFTPNLRVFIDDRCELYGDDRLLAYVHAKPVHFEAWEEEFGFDIALVKPGSPFDAYLRGADRWDIVKQTSAAALYRKSGKLLRQEIKEASEAHFQLFRRAQEISFSAFVLEYDIEIDRPDAIRHCKGIISDQAKQAYSFCQTRDDQTEHDKNVRIEPLVLGSLKQIVSRQSQEHVRVVFEPWRDEGVCQTRDKHHNHLSLCVFILSQYRQSLDTQACNRCSYDNKYAVVHPWGHLNAKAHLNDIRHILHESKRAWIVQSSVITVAENNTHSVEVMLEDFRSKYHGGQQIHQEGKSGDRKI